MGLTWMRRDALHAAQGLQLRDQPAPNHAVNRDERHGLTAGGAAAEVEGADIDAFLGQAAQDSPFLQARSRIWSALHRGEAAGPGSRLDNQR